MPGIRSLARSVVVVACIIIAIVVVAVIQNAFACPIPATPTLRTLVMKSDRIVVASIGESAVMNRKELEEGYSYSLKMTSLHVSSTVKGDAGELTLYVHHDVWAEGTVQQYDRFSDKGKTYLLFLKRREQGDGYELADESHGKKELSDEDMKIYLRRIEELVSIMREEKPDKREIVEWLVRCAEEPATRWDGVVELAMSANMQAAAEKKAAARANKAASLAGEDINAVHDLTEEISFEMDVYFAEAEVDATYAAELTGEQKDRLAAVLLNLQEIGDNDAPLVALLESWKDARLAPFLVAYLRKVSDNPPYFVEGLMMTVARLLDDKEITGLAQEYIKQSSYREVADDEEVAESDGAESEPEAAATAESEVETAESEESTAAEQPDKRTDAQRRSEMLLRFIARVENQAQPESALLEARAN